MSLHPDFAGLPVEPGELHVTDGSDAFGLVNLVAFGGAADRPTHVPVELGALGPTVLWESTGAADALPFWNTNHDGDAYLYLVHGSVRVEFKETGGTRHHGHLLARTGDLFRMPGGIAHRTFSGDGKRRISLEIVPRNPFWADLGTEPVVPDHGGRVGGFAFTATDDAVVVRTPDGERPAPREMFLRAVRALVAYEMHLGTNELDGGLIVTDRGDEVELRLDGYAERLPRRDVLAVFAGLRERGP